MSEKINFPALRADIFIDENVTVTNDEGLTIHLTKEDWELFRKEFRFDDIVDYERGETPMTVYQFQTAIDLFNTVKHYEEIRDQQK